MNSKLRCVIIGGGVAGACLSKDLSKRGLEVILLEKSSMLCSGATWHAAGLVTRFAGSSKLKKIHVRSLELMEDLQNQSDIGLHLPGSIRIIEKGDQARYLEAKHHYEMSKLYDLPGLETQILPPEEIGRVHPLVSTNNIECGLYTPHDGDVDPTSLTNAVAKTAKQQGARYSLNTRVVDVSRLEAGGFKVATLDHKQQPDEITCDLLVNAAGLWSTAISDMMNIPHPAVVIEHQYVITESIPQLVDRKERVPVLRDLRGSTYIRQERTGLLLGPYEKECVVHDEWKHGPPVEWDMQLFDPSIDRMAECLEAVMDLVPVVGEVGIQNVTNGPTIWKADSLARVGGTSIPGYYEFNSLTYGIAQSLALSEYLTHIMLDGEQPFDAASEFFPGRFASWQNPEYLKEKVQDTYSRNNQPVYPYENRTAGRDKLSKGLLYKELEANGACFGIANGGVESPLYFQDSDDSRILRDNTFYHHDWQDIVEKEASMVHSSVGVSHLSFSKLLLKGCDSKETYKLLTKIGTNTPPKRSNRCKLTYLTSPSGFVVSEFSMCKRPNGDYYLVGARDMVEFDKWWIQLQADKLGLDVSVVDITPNVEIIHIAGPDSQKALSSLLSEDTLRDLKFLHIKASTLNTPKEEPIPVNVFRVSFTGLPGYELHVDAQHAHQVFRHLQRAASCRGGGVFGSLALNSLRVEVAFKLRADLDYVHYSEAGIEMFTKNKDFIGKDDTRLPTRKHVILKVDCEEGWEWSVGSDCPIFSQSKGIDDVLGVTTTTAKGARTGHSYALGYMFTSKYNTDESPETANDLVVSAFGKIWPVTILDCPPARVGVVTQSEPSSQGEMQGEPSGSRISA
ncbi:hypothetical protein AAMO2058_000359200 [Amorphochlora amoebiformis]